MCAVAAWTAAAHAHAFLDHARPAVGSSVSGSPAAVELWFTEALEPAFSTIQVTSAAGERVDDGGARVEAMRLSVALKPLPPGRYKVVWRVVSVDTHVTNGTFSFEVTR